MQIIAGYRNGNLMCFDNERVINLVITEGFIDYRGNAETNVV